MPEPTFLDLYTSYIGLGECPPCFNTWCGLFTLSVAMGRRCYVDFSIKKMYPNMYIFIIGEAGLQRKSTAIDHASGIIRQLEPPVNLIAQKISPQKLIEALVINEPSIDGKISLIQRAEGYLLCDEVKNFIDRHVYESGLGPMLTAFYDCKTEWAYDTKSGGKQKLNNILFGILAGSSYQFLREALPEAAIGSGVTRRIVFVSTPEIPEGQPFPRMNTGLLGPILQHLRTVSAMAGNFTFEKSLSEVYEKMYLDFRQNSKLYKDPATDTYASCRFDHVFKVAMCLSVNERFDRHITTEMFIRAADLLAEQERHLPTLIRSLTMTEYGKLLEWVKGLIWGGVESRRELMRVTSSKMSAFDLDAYLDTLEQSGAIRRTHTQGDVLLTPNRGSTNDL